MQYQKFVCAAILTVACGCGGDKSAPKLVTATGTVVFKGKPIAGATVTMMADKGAVSNGFTDADGKFRMTTGGRPGVPVGKLKVGITKVADSSAATATPKAMRPEDMMAVQKAGGGVAVDLTPKSEIPEKYANPETSHLEALIDANSANNVFEFNLVE